MRDTESTFKLSGSHLSQTLTFSYYYILCTLLLRKELIINSEHFYKHTITIGLEPLMLGVNGTSINPYSPFKCQREC